MVKLPLFEKIGKKSKFSPPKDKPTIFPRGVNNSLNLTNKSFFRGVATSASLIPSILIPSSSFFKSEWWLITKSAPSSKH